VEQNERRQRKADKVGLLHQTSSGTLMGKLLRTFWQPIGLSKNLAKGSARAIRVMGEDLTVYRGESGQPHLVAGRCAHRGTVLHTGWVEQDQIRCMYHGWRYDATGLCTEIPAEKQPRPDPIRIVAYPLHEYAGLIFAYMGEAPAPPFELPRKHFIDEPGRHIVAVEQVWDCNWFQQIENSLDAVHVSFAHRWGKSTRFDQGITTSIPELSYLETSSGIRQIATRAKDNVRISDWTFPNNNHVLVPGPTKGDPWSDITIWRTPIDDGRTMRLAVFSFPESQGEPARQLAEGSDKDYNPTDYYEELFHRREVRDLSDMQFITAQDYVAVRGQGTIMDRTTENLSSSDAGIVLLRKVFLRELDAISQGQATKQWSRPAEKFELPVPASEAAG
jgi:5,5'-dehydrodivanillate O-demethylase